MNIQSYEYKNHVIVQMPSGTCLVHVGPGTGELIGQQPSLGQAMALVDRQLVISERVRADAVEEPRT